jgi:beta-glucosidase
MRSKTTTLAIVLLALLLNLSGCATQPTPADIAFAAVAQKTHSALAPEPQTEDWWMPRHEAVNKRVAQGNVDLLLIGDSITHEWDSQKGLWAKYYARRNAVNMGFSGDRTQNVLWRLDNGNIDNIDPKLAVIMIGTNNSNGSDNTAEEIGDGIIAICSKLRTELPETKILILAIFPCGSTPSPQRQKNQTASEIASQIADGKMIHYLDINSEFLTDDGTLPRDIMPDLLHPNKKGYEIWAAAVEPKIAELMGE